MVDRLAQKENGLHENICSAIYMFMLKLDAIRERMSGPIDNARILCCRCIHALQRVSSAEDVSSVEVHRWMYRFLFFDGNC